MNIAHNLLDIKVLGSYSQQPSRLRRTSTRETGYMLPGPYPLRAGQKAGGIRKYFSIDPYPALLAGELSAYLARVSEVCNDLSRQVSAGGIRLVPCRLTRRC